MRRALALALALLAAGPAIAAPSRPDVTLERDVAYGRVEDNVLRLDLYRPSPLPARPLPVIVYIHGGGWREGDKVFPMGRAFARANFAVASIAYRLSATTRFPGFLEDCKCAVRYLRANAARWGLDGRRIGVWGQSAGGHLAMMVALTPGRWEGTGGWAETSSRVQAAVDVFGPSDLADPDLPPDLRNMIQHGFGRDPARLREASPVRHVRRDAPPSLIIHGELDPLVPISQSRRLHAALRAAGADSTLLAVANAEHFFDDASRPTQQQILRTIRSFFDRHLR